MRFGMLIVTFFALISPATLRAQEPEAPLRLALLIGNKGYDEKVGPLKNPHNDIELVGKSLEAIGFEIMPLVKDATRGRMLTAVQEFAERLQSAAPGSIGFMYYSGHGAAEPGRGANYLIPVNASAPTSSEFWNDSLKLDEVTKALEVADEAAKFVVFDACRNELKLPASKNRQHKNMGGVGEDKGFNPFQRWSPGLMVAYAAAPGQVASDAGERSGFYAKVLAEQLLRRNQNHLDLFQNVQEIISDATLSKQLPWTSSGLTKRIYLKPPHHTPYVRAMIDVIYARRRAVTANN